MKRIGILALAATMMAGAAVPAGAAPMSAPKQPSAGLVTVGWDKPKHGDRSDNRHKGDNQKHSSNKHGKSHWQRGQKYSNWKHHKDVDWRRHHLHRPGPSQRWIRVDDQYLLVSVLTGVIVGAMASGY